jgi:hypothetical protein
MGNKVRLVSNIGSFSIYELPKYALFIRIRLGIVVSCLFYQEHAQTANFACIEHIMQNVTFETGLNLTRIY